MAGGTTGVRRPTSSGCDRPGHHDPHHGRVAGELARDRDIHGSDVIQVAGTGGSAGERGGIDRDGHVRSLACHGGPVGQVQPLTTDLVERIRATLGWRAVVVAAVPRSRVHHRA
jgi:hypothetical protein